MAVKYALELREYLLQEIFYWTWGAPRLRFYTGAAPATVEEAPTGTLLATFNLPNFWVVFPTSPVMYKDGTWSATAVADGVAGYFRLKGETDPYAMIQGTIGEAGSGADMIFDDTDIISGQSLLVQEFTITANNP